MFKIWGVDWFIKPLLFTDDQNRDYWDTNYFTTYLDHLLTVWIEPKIFDRFLASQDFLIAFMGIAKIRLKSINVIVYETDVREYFLLSYVVICLYDAVKKIYDDYNTSLEPLFDNKLKHLKKKTKSENWNVLEILTWEKSEIRLTKFELKVENCLWKLQWAVDFLEMINTPLRVLKDEKSSVLTPKTDSKFGYRLENHFKEGIYNCYSREMFEYWGVNGFVKCFGSSIYRKTDLCFYQFQSYLGNLLNVWSTPGNLDKFIMSPDFWNTFLDIAKFILESSKFVGVWEARNFFRLCFVVIILIDADSKICDDYNTSLEPLFENALESLKKRLAISQLNILKILTKSETDSRLKEFHLKVQNRSWKSIWATDFVRITLHPLVALITEYSSLVSENSYFTWVHQLETNSQVEKEIRFCNEIFKVWGVDGFIKISNTYQYLNDFANSCFFGYYLGNLLKVWDARGNMDEFLTSPSFLNRVMDLGIACLQKISFYSEKRYLYISVCRLSLFVCLMRTRRFTTNSTSNWNHHFSLLLKN